MTDRCTSSKAHGSSSRRLRLASLPLVVLAGLLTACVEDAGEDPVEDPDPTVRMTALEDMDDVHGVESDEVVTWATLPALCGMTYDDANLQGTQNELSNNEEMAFNNTRISSLVVGPNCTIKLKTGGGSSKNFSGGAGGTFWWFVGSDWNDRAARAQCTCTSQRSVGALIYEDANYTGNYVPLWSNTAGSLAGGWNDRVTAQKTKDGTSLALTENSPPGGRAYVSTGDSTANVGSSFNDRTSHFVHGGTLWNQCGLIKRCYRTNTACGGLSDFSETMVDCFVGRGGASYCQEAVNGSHCIPRSATPF